MPWSSLEMDVNFQKSNDDGKTWANYNTGVLESERTVTLRSGQPSQDLWTIPDKDNAQGMYRSHIDWDSVKLWVPEKQEGNFKGKVTWSLDSIP